MNVGSLRRITALALSLVLMPSIVTACGDSREAEEPSAEQTTDVGARVYGESCASCHGSDLQGTDQGPSQLSIVYEPNHHTDDSYRSAIANGTPQHHWNFGDMAPIEGLTEAEVEAVIAFIRSEQQRLGFER